MLDFPIVDSHVHLWDPTTFPTPWLSTIPQLNSRHLVTDYMSAMESYKVESFVFVECTRGTGTSEAIIVSKMANQFPALKAIVAWAPIETGNVVSERLYELSKISKVKGIRRLLEFETNPEFCLKKAFLEGLKTLEEYDYSFDICISHSQLPQVIKMVDKFPDIRFILDHCAKPDIQHKKIDFWSCNMKQLALNKNIYCKISGLINCAAPYSWVLDDIKPYYDIVMEYFGIDHVLYGSDWPMSKLATTKNNWLTNLELLTGDLTYEEKRLLFSDNAKKVYKIN